MSHVITAAASGYTYKGSVDLDVITCPTCAITYAIPAALRSAAQKYNRTDWPNNTLSWYCPNGHSLSFPGKSEETKLRERLEREKDRRAAATARASRAEASAKAQRGAATRARNERDRSKKRHAAGVCPCCNRSFKQLRRHMHSQHPDYAPEGEA